MRYLPISPVRRWLLGAAVALVAAPASRADSITADFNDVSPSQAVTVTLGNVTFKNMLAGTFNWTNVQPPTSFLAPSFQSYCIELGVGVQSRTTFTLTDLSPRFDAGTASRIREFWGENIAAAGASASNAAAFQLGLWEIVNESATTPLDLSSGNFKVNAAAVGTQATAQSWLNNVNGQGTFADGLIVLDSADSQDQIVQPPPSTVPVPPAAILGGMGLVSLVGYGLRRRQMLKKA